MALSIATLPAFGQTRKVVATQADLPRFSYPVELPPSSLLLADDASFAKFLAPVLADAERVLADYDVQDKATRRQLLTVRRNAQLLAHDDPAALTTTRQIRELEDKPDARLWSGLWAEAFLQARLATDSESGAAFDAAFRREYAARVDAMPWPLLAARAREDKGRYEIGTPMFLQGMVKAQIDPAAAGKVLDAPSAWVLLNYRASFVRGQLLVAKPAVEVLAAYIARNDIERPDIWAARDVSLNAADRTVPVRVAVWDSGVDPRVYASQLYTDPHPGPHDAHGLAFDDEARPAHGALLPLTAAQQRAYPAMVGLIKGMRDQLSGIDSAESQTLKRHLATLSPDQAPAFWEQLTLYGNYVHGSHVAGITLRGNPAAQLVIARLGYGWKNVPTLPTEALVRRMVAVYDESVRYFRQHGVRVVNMSWGGGPADYESDLEKNGVGRDAAERQRIARGLFEIDRQGLEAAIRSAPEILFICAAGNSNRDAGFDETIPSSLKLPNLLTAGAVDQAGDETSFTSYGDSVRVYANGFNVLSRVPGGREVPLSGTSMASPNVSNLAAKLIALQPTLTPEQTIALIIDGATPSTDGRRRLIDPRASVARLQRESAITTTTPAASSTMPARDPAS